MRNHSHIASSNDGFALLEVLIAVVVLSFGLLGVAGLQVASVKTTQSSYFRTIANERANDIIDRMRANILTHVYANQAAIALSYIPVSSGGTLGTTTKTCDATTNVCSDSELAYHDISAWNTTNAVLLPSGQGIVCLTSTPDAGTPTAPACDGGGSQYVVKIWWDDSRGRQAVNAGDTTTWARHTVIFQP